MHFSYKTMLIKGVKALVLYGLPFALGKLMDFYPEVMSLSLGTVLIMLVNILKVKVGLRLP